MAPLDVEDCLPCLNKAVVFTVVGEIPPENGQYLLRPNYFGKIKYSYDVRNIDWSVLPGINPKPPISTAPSLRRQMNAFAPHRTHFLPPSSLLPPILMHHADIIFSFHLIQS